MWSRDRTSIITGFIRVSFMLRKRGRKKYLLRIQSCSERKSCSLLRIQGGYKSRRPVMPSADSPYICWRKRHQSRTSRHVYYDRKLIYIFNSYILLYIGSISISRRKLTSLVKWIISPVYWNSLYYNLVTIITLKNKMRLSNWKDLNVIFNIS